jgi:hypothetical protein
MLQPMVLPNLQRLLNPILQHDNAPLHATRATIQFLEETNFDIFPWSDRSPDLAPIEGSWECDGKTVE